MNAHSTHQKNWLERDWKNWKSDIPTDQLLDELQVFPSKLAGAIKNISHEALTHRDGDAWSIQEHIGHLLCMESLWIARLDDFAMDHAVLRPWNGNNNDVRAARLNEQSIRAIFRDLEACRHGMVEYLRALPNLDDPREIHHERLNRNFTLEDHIAFIAEHDHHHLQTIKHRLNG